MEKEVPVLSVGDKSIKGKRLKPFASVWHMGAGGPDARMREKAKLGKIEGKACYIRTQIQYPQPGIEIHATLALDARTLQTVRFEQELKGLPDGASIGGQPQKATWVFDGIHYKRTLIIDGKEEATEGMLETLRFDGNALGLVIAALPLKKGYQVQLPVVMTLGLDPTLVEYDVRVRVVGNETFARPKGKSVKAWICEVDWLDPKTGEVTSKGGASEPGGSYFVVPKPPKAYPHVPRYANAGGVIEYLPKEKYEVEVKGE